MTKPLWGLSVGELRPRLASGSLKAEALMASVLDHVAMTGAAVNAFAHVAGDAALVAARQADLDREGGKPCGPLHGIPFSVKDLLAVEGMPHENASEAFAGDIPATDAEAVRRLRAAGAIPFAKSTTPEFGHKVLTDSPRHGISRNPYDPTRSCGGSSGGAGIATAMGFGPVHVSTDGAGSGRIPASCCGVVGLKPTWSAVPHETTTDLFGSLTCIGQMGRTVGDVTAMFNVMKGPDPRDPWSHGGSSDPVALPRDPVAALAGLRIRYLPRTVNAWLDPEVEAAVGDSVGRLVAAGARLVAPLAEPDFDIASALVLMRAYQAARFGHLLTEFGDRMDRTARLSLMPQPELHTYDRLKDAARARTDIFRSVEALLADVDVVVTPTVSTPALPVDQQADGALIVDGVDRGPLRQSWYPYTIPFNASGHPALSVPAGFSASGLPIGLQVFGRWHDEARLLAVAAAVEVLKPWAQRWPGAAGMESFS